MFEMPYNAEYLSAQRCNFIATAFTQLSNIRRLNKAIRNLVTALVVNDEYLHAKTRLKRFHVVYIMKNCSRFM